MRILYLGLPIGALCLARAGHRPLAVATGHPAAPGARRLRRRLAPRGTLLLGRPELTDPAVRRLLEGIRPDVLLSFFWPRPVPPALLASCPRGAFGLHPSLLPRWRGPDPYFWTVRAGERETGVTLFRLAEGYDTGPIVAQRRLPVPAGADAWQLARRLDRPALELLLECALRLAAGEALDGEPQDAAQATEAPRPSAEQLAIDWGQPAAQIVRLVRAARPSPGASARLGDTVVEVVEARLATTPPPAALRTAEAWHAPEGLVVRAGDGDGVLLARVRDEDGRTVEGTRLLPRG